MGTKKKRKIPKATPVPSRAQQLLSRLTLGTVLALVFGAFSLWEITEQDIYWQIRSGDELLRTRVFPHVDTWSYAAKGQPWMNGQWITTLIFRAAFYFGPTGLVLARGALVFVLFDELGRLVEKHAGPRAKVLAVPLACTAAYVATVFRLQLRADLLVFALFTSVLLHASARALSYRWLLFLVVLAANIHPGTAPFVVVAAGYVIVISKQPWRAKAWMAPSLGLAMFVTPYHFGVLPFLKRHFFYFEGQVLTNPDHQKWDSALHLDTDKFGLAGLCWLGFSAVGAVGVLLCLLGSKERRWRALLALCLLVGFTWLAHNRVRAIPYHVLFIAPFVAHALRFVHIQLRRRRLPKQALVLAPLGLAAALFAAHLSTNKLVLGFAESRGMYPIDSVAFIRKNGIRPNIYHTFAFGAYTVWYLREFPDFVDPRETPFRGVEEDYLKAYGSAEHAQKLYQRYGINAVLVPIPKTAMVPGLGYRDLIEEYLPSESWALVYWDDISVLVVRRIPEHAQIIKDHEYRLLRPNLPPGNLLAYGKPKPEQLRTYAHEIERCLAERPHDPVCKSSDVALARYKKQHP
jgi:hypothetical protein